MLFKYIKFIFQVATNVQSNDAGQKKTNNSFEKSEDQNEEDEDSHVINIIKNVAFQNIINSKGIYLF